MLNKKEWGGAVEFFMEAKIFEDIEQKKRGILSNDPSPSPLEGKELIHIYVKKLYVISSDLPFIEWHVRCTMNPFKPLLDQGIRRYSYLYSEKLCAKKPCECTLARGVHCTVYSVISSLPALNLY